MSCPACRSALYDQTFDAWVCSSCGYFGPRDDAYAMSTHILTTGYGGEYSVHIPRTERILGTIKRFREISAKDDEAALSYMEFTAFAEEDELNKHYLAAQLAIKLLIKESAYKHLIRNPAKSCIKQG